jgi:PAS domain S-box-containing protein
VECTTDTTCDACQLHLELPDIPRDVTRCFVEKKSFSRMLTCADKISGHPRQLEIQYTFVPPDFVLVRSEDVTERDHAAQQLRIQHELALGLASTNDLREGLRLCVNAAMQATGLDAGGFYLLDTKTGGLDLVVHEGLSPAFIRRVSRFEANSDHVRLISAGMPVYARFDQMGLQLSEDEVREELRLLAVIPMSNAGQVIGCLNVTSRKVDDISVASRNALETIALGASQAIARLKTEAELRDATERLSLAVESAELGTWDWNIATGKVVLNEYCARMQGFEIAEAPSDIASWEQLVHPQDVDAVRTAILEHLEGKTPAFETEHRLRCKNGEWVWILDKGKVIERAADGQPLRACGTHLNITNRKRSEQEQLAMERHLLEVQKLESLGVLAGGIAHDFNNLLAGIFGYADLVLMQLTELEPARADVEVIKSAAHRAAELTRQLLAYSGKGKLVVKPFSLSEVVESNQKLLAVSISKKASMTFHLAPDLPWVEGDASQISQLLMNLIINASEAMGEDGGTISVSVHPTWCDKAHLRSMRLDRELPAGLYACLEVSDNGCGMDERTLARIFDPFFTTKFTGRGLGLSAVHGIVRGHHGAIHVSSHPGRGTTFRVFLPATKATAPLESTGDTLSVRETGTILIVDDEDLVRSLARRMAEHAGFSVITASGGREAIRLYRQHYAEIRCVLLDLTMPDLDGLETLRELRRIRPEVRVVVSSGYNEETVAERFAGQIVAGFLRKPYQSATIIAALRNALETETAVTRPTPLPQTTFRDSGASQAESGSAAADGSMMANVVLIVDDDEMVRRSTQITFQLAGFPVLLAASGEEALQVYQQHRDHIACIYLDLNMPRMNGEQTLRALRHHGLSARVIIASGCCKDELEPRFVGQDVWQFYQKLEPLGDLVALLVDAMKQS